MNKLLEKDTKIETKTENKTEKLLVSRMLSSGDVCAIGLPVLRNFQKTHPDAEIHFLTFGDGAELIKLAELSVYVHHITEEQWSDDFFLATESFLGLAEDIIAANYAQIVNLDTTFMPCFLADAGEPLGGHYLNVSVQQLLRQVQNKSLQADYVNTSQAFMASSFANMHKWYSRWWQYDVEDEGGYPEFYLSKCCGLIDDKLEQDILVNADKRLVKKGKRNKVIGLCLGQSDDGYLYPYADSFKKGLEQKGYVVWTELEAKRNIRLLLKVLAASDLMVGKPSGNRWYTQAVDCSTLLIRGDGESALLMPDFATDTVMTGEQHGADTRLIQSHALPRNGVKPENLLESIESILVHLEEQNNE